LTRYTLHMRNVMRTWFVDIGETLGPGAADLSLLEHIPTHNTVTAVLQLIHARMTAHDLGLLIVILATRSLEARITSNHR